MKRLVNHLVLAALAAFTLNCGSGTTSDPIPSRADCEELRAHVVDLRLSPASTGASSAKTEEHDSSEIDKHRVNLIASLGDEFIDTCTQERTPANVECALEASSRDDVKRCQ